MLKIYRKRAVEGGWPAEAVNMDSNSLKYDAATFTHIIVNALLFVLPNDCIDAVKEMYRTLKPGELPPKLRAISDKWSEADFLHSIVEQGGFSKDAIAVHRRDVYFTSSELDRYANILWSFIGGTTPAGWLESDEENWDEAIEVIMRELKKTDGYSELPDGKSQLMFTANIAVATK